jgi:hypothetical protein
MIIVEFEKFRDAESGEDSFSSSEDERDHFDRQ